MMQFLAKSAIAEISEKEFFSQSVDKQREILRQAIQNYRKKLDNISADVVSYCQVVNYTHSTDELGKQVLWEGRCSHNSLRRIGNSYRDEYWSEEKYNSSGSKLPGKTFESYDAKLGINRILEEHRFDGKFAGNFAVIQTTRLPPTSDCFLYQYLGDVDDLLETLNPGAWFLEYGGTTTITSSGKEHSIVEARFPHPTSLDSGVGSDTLRFDLKKDLMLSGFDISCNYPNASGKSEYSSKVVVDQSISVKGIWVPTKARWVAWESTSPNEISVHHFEISNVNVGTLVAKDLEVTFPAGTKVFDGIAGQRWQVGKTGEKLEVMPADPPGQAANALTPAPGRRLSLWLTAFVTVMLSLFVVLKQFRVRRGVA